VELPLDIVLVVVFTLVQWRISWLLLASVDRHIRGGGRRAARTAIFLFDVLVAVSYSFTFSSLLGRLRIPGRIGLVMGAGALAYLMSATAVLALQQFLSVIRKHLAADVNPGRRRVLNAAGNVLMASPFVVMGYGALVQRTDFRVREVDVPVPGLPPDLDGLRVLQLSDIHLSAFLSESELARVIDASNELRPHLAVVTGDLISSHTDPLDACIRQLARIKTDAGILGCLGNHEVYAKVEKRTVEMGARAGVQFLRGQSRRLRFGDSVLNVAGVDFQSYREKRRYLQGAERMIVPGAMNLLLAHNPDVFPVAARQGYNLLLAGHTHGGQVTVEILDQSINPARFFTPYVYGLYRLGAASAYVTRGIGTIGIPARIGAPPEISVLRLRKA
jgi:predicted MPP superfamily phosphohydrolase